MTTFAQTLVIGSALALGGWLALRHRRRPPPGSHAARHDDRSSSSGVEFIRATLTPGSAEAFPGLRFRWALALEGVSAEGVRRAAGEVGQAEGPTSPCDEGDDRGPGGGA